MSEDGNNELLQTQHEVITIIERMPHQDNTVAFMTDGASGRMRVPSQTSSSKAEEKVSAHQFANDVKNRSAKNFENDSCLHRRSGLRLCLGRFVSLEPEFQRVARAT